ncbi:hypothetical protein EXN66_Car006468 [Channa argus]|uniref:Uncharacterized protein n=1 Tax=Channa argus TaxID=215402 RepID=A0A6G1PKX5_CHAAH|nr:hypothetical protein EXN66_Car006468 [Channa argus]
MMDFKSGGRTRKSSEVMQLCMRTDSPSECKGSAQRCKTYMLLLFKCHLLAQTKGDMRQCSS